MFQRYFCYAIKQANLLSQTCLSDWKTFYCRPFADVLLLILIYSSWKTRVENFIAICDRPKRLDRFVTNKFLSHNHKRQTTKHVLTSALAEMCSPVLKMTVYSWTMVAAARGLNSSVIISRPTNVPFCLAMPPSKFLVFYFAFKLIYCWLTKWFSLVKSLDKICEVVVSQVK